MFRVEERNGSLQQNRHINSNEICDNMEGMFTGMTKAVLWTITSSNQSSREFDICLSVHRYYKRREENQLDATKCFIALTICSTCFGHLYAHHQELETTLLLWTHMVCNALVAGGRRLGAGQQAVRPG